MYDVTIQYIEKNVLKGIEAKEIFLTPGEEPLRKKYKHWNQEIRQRENEAKRKMKEDGLPYEEQMHRFAEYAQREFEDMKYVYVLGVINDIVSLRWNLLTVDGKIVHKQLLEVVENNVDNLTADKKEESQC